MKAEFNNNYNLVNLLLNKGADIHAADNNGNKAVHFAASDSSLETLKLLIDSGANPEERNYRDETPLHCAARSGNLEIVKFLVDECGADLNARSKALNTPLHEASQHGHPEVVKFLIQRGADIKIRNARFEIASHLISCSNVLSSFVTTLNSELVKALVNAPDINGNTLLHKLVVKHAAPELISKAIEVGGSTDKLNKFGHRPIDLALHEKFFVKG